MPSGAYDTSRMYRSGSHTLDDDDARVTVAAAPARADRLAHVVTSDIAPAAAAAVAYSEYLMAAADLPAEQRAVLDALRRQAHRILWSLGAVPAPTDATVAPKREGAVA
jgi:hypothetical protein